jgi:hypothetical protein
MNFGAGVSLAFHIFTMADEDFPEDDIDVHKVNGLGLGVDTNPVGYLVFCKPRIVIVTSSILGCWNPP